MAEFAKSLTYGVDAENPPVTMTVTIAETGAKQNWTNADSVVFNMRNQDTGTLKIDGVAAAFGSDRTTGELIYTLHSGDFDTRGDYVGWFVIYWQTSQNQPQPTTAVEILVRNPWEMVVI